VTPSVAAPGVTHPSDATEEKSPTMARSDSVTDEDVMMTKTMMKGAKMS